MNWFERVKAGFKSDKKKDIPGGLWVKCESCGEILYRKDLERNYKVCPRCSYHFRLTWEERLEMLADEGTAQEIDENMISVDPLRFRSSKGRYADQLRDYRRKTNLNEAIWTGLAKIGGRPVALGIMNYGFAGGSMGSVVGEKVARLIDRAIQDRMPLIIVSQSGGARMYESSLSLMQMAKTSAKLAQLSDAGLLYISVMVDPTTGGVTASFAMLGDINIAEPNALIGFAGPRIIKETIGRDELPEGFQRAESILEHGFLDMIIHRKGLKPTLIKLIEMVGQRPQTEIEQGVSGADLFRKDGSD